MASVQYRINSGTKGILVTLAVICDGLQGLFKILIFTGFLIPLSEAMGWFITIFFFLIVGIIFIGLGVNPASGANSLRFIFALLIEMVPVGNSFPSLTLYTLGVIRNSRIEDEKRAGASAKMGLRNRFRISRFRGRRGAAHARMAAEHP